MKKIYLSPDVEITRVSLEENFLTSTRNATSSMDLTITDITDDGSYWDYE